MMSKFNRDEWIDLKNRLLELRRRKPNGNGEPKTTLSVGRYLHVTN